MSFTDTSLQDINGKTQTSNTTDNYTLRATDESGNTQDFVVSIEGTKDARITTDGMDIQYTTTKISFTTVSTSKIELALKIGAKNRNLKVSNGTTSFLVGLGANTSTLYVSEKIDNVVCSLNTSIVTVTINNADATTWFIQGTGEGSASKSEVKSISIQTNQ